MASRIEKRYIRYEDWHGNVYIPASSGGASGSVAQGSEATETGSSSAITTDGEVVEDTETSSGKSVYVEHATYQKTAMVAIFDDVSFGSVVFDIRIKSTIGSGDGDVLIANVYYHDDTTDLDSLLCRSTFTHDNIGTANSYVEIGFAANYSGVHTSSYGVKIELLTVANSGADLYIDYIAANKAFPTLVGII